MFGKSLFGLSCKLFRVKIVVYNYYGALLLVDSTMFQSYWQGTITANIMLAESF